MANTIGSGLNGVIVAREVLNAFTGFFSPLNAFSKDFSPDPANRYDTVNVGYVPAASSAQDFSGSYTKQDSTVNKKGISLSQQKYVSWHITDIERAKSPIVDKVLFAQQKGYQLALAVFQDILSVVTNANYGTAGLVSTAANFDPLDVVDLKSVCDKANMPKEPRALILAADHYNALLKDAGVAAAYSYGSAVAKTDGTIPKLYGFTPYESTLIPANSEYLVGMAAYPSGILLANRYLEPGARPVDGIYEAMTDPKTGLTLGYREYYDNSAGDTVCILECLYGYAVGETNAIKRITSQ